MTTRKTDVMKPCGLCGKTPKDIYYDAPTEAGPWANMCEDCHQKQPYSQLGTKFVLRTKVEPVSGILDGIDINTLEAILFDEVREIQCHTVRSYDRLSLMQAMSTSAKAVDRK